MQRRALLKASGALAAWAGVHPVQGLAQGASAAWPLRPVRLVVPAPPGSSLDVVARLLADRLKPRWGQPVLVENKPGAGGVLGMDVAAKAAPDGLTLALGYNGPVALAPFLMHKLPYDPVKDLRPVSLLTLQPNLLAVNARLPVATPQALAAWARDQGGKLNVASVGLGSASHLAMAWLLAEAGAQGTHVPYNGSPAAAMSVAAGETDAVMAAAPALLPLARAGKLRLLAVTGHERLTGDEPIVPPGVKTGPQTLKDLPTLVESGFPKMELLIWNGLFVASATPEAVVQKIHADVAAVLADPAVRQALALQGLQPVNEGPQAFAQRIEADRSRWGPLIQRLGVRLE